jgi:predicted metal-binding membrane protein
MQRHWKPIIGGLTLLAAGLWGWSIFARDWR